MPTKTSQKFPSGCRCDHVAARQHLAVTHRPTEKRRDLPRTGVANVSRRNSSGRIPAVMARSRTAQVRASTWPGYWVTQVKLAATFTSPLPL